MRKSYRAITAFALAGSILAGCAASDTTTTTSVSPSTTEEVTTVAETTTEEVTTQEATTEAETQAVTYAPEGYELMWEDNFDGSKLNEDYWNYELHEPGWVNHELQTYLRSKNNIFLRDGKLVIKAVKYQDADGKDCYTSGRVNTQNKVDFTYGYVEASIKMPAGKGFLPAFWMMPTEESKYGQWPKCGEIDIAEILGHKTTTTYGTIHYGTPHKQDQGIYTLKEGDFTTEFHTYALEWMPGQLNWYVDGQLIHTADSWYSSNGEVTQEFPAPFDQDFYIILNLAVGGDWPGKPDDTTDFDKAEMEIDFVRVYQKTAE